MGHDIEAITPHRNLVAFRTSYFHGEASPGRIGLAWETHRVCTVVGGSPAWQALINQLITLRVQDTELELALFAGLPCDGQEQLDFGQAVMVGHKSLGDLLVALRRWQGSIGSGLLQVYGQNPAGPARRRRPGDDYNRPQDEADQPGSPDGVSENIRQSAS